MGRRNNRFHLQHKPSASETPDLPVTSWNEVSDWYVSLVGNGGHYYHQHVIFPRLSKIWRPESSTRVLDMGCGQGVLAAWLGKGVEYVGIDAARSLIEQARKHSTDQHTKFEVADATQPLPESIINKEHFTDIFYLLSLQNMRDQQASITQAYDALQKNGHLHIVLNHPHYRIPRQSGWGEHITTRQVYRWVNRYLTAQEIPIATHPGSKKSPITWSFHHSLTDYSNWFKKLGLAIELIEEWSSDKESKGKVAKQENLVRTEIPLFMYLRMIKL
jgi:ubiquinone/menaquinone biosynthesis C-methylase UbiE